MRRVVENQTDHQSFMSKLALAAIRFSYRAKSAFRENMQKKRVKIVLPKWHFYALSKSQRSRCSKY